MKPTRENVYQWYRSWIAKRRALGIVIEERPYQFDKIYEMICTSTNTKNNKFVLAAAPGAGKTLMTIIYIDWRIHIKKDYKILVLTHGLKSLKEQFLNSSQYYQADLIDFKNVIIDLPFKSKKFDYESLDEIIIDEAHQYYFAEDGMVQSIIEKSNPKRQIFLTGSPHQFILENQLKPKTYKISIIDAYTLWNLDIIQNVLIEVASTNYQFNLKDFNKSGDLLEGIDISTKTKEVMFEMMEKILARLRSVFKNKPVIYKKYIDGTSMENFFVTQLFKNKIGKTMIACRNTTEANIVREFLIEYGYNSEQIVQSTANIKQSKKEESLILKFKRNKEVKFLIVIYNGILGFDFSELCNVIDLTCSKNVSRLFQLYCRLVRKSDEKMNKFYYKIVPYDQVFFFEKLMEGVLHLGHEHFLKLFNGNNFFEIPIVRKKEVVKEEKIKQEAIQQNQLENKEKTKKDATPTDVFKSFSSVFNMIKLSHTGDASIDSKSFTTLQHVMYNLGMSEKIDWKEMSEEQLMEMAKNTL